eukprot:TRINITY_DN22179_c0_g1_i1.p1 TRINITY_DN22179_c0_g1~~TRINITY_DN22179_c0_g1_i1.p1  ORF type:complete len:203 (-),score=34.49 TRINITY_DN22179_c0_g1_i1:32-640(-)
MPRTKGRKFADVKKRISPYDSRIRQNQKKKEEDDKKREQTKMFENQVVRHVPRVSSALFFSHNQSLGPPFHILLDTNFINFALQNKLEIVSAMMDCLYAKCIPCVTDCVLAELEKLGKKFRVALRIAKDPRFERLACNHKGTYADDCLVDRVTMHKCYIVATCDKDLKRRLRKIPGVPIMYVKQHRFTIERMPEAYGAPRDG